jgi:hypothetical protein
MTVPSDATRRAAAPGRSSRQTQLRRTSANDVLIITITEVPRRPPITNRAHEPANPPSNSSRGLTTTFKCVKLDRVLRSPWKAR